MLVELSTGSFKIMVQHTRQLLDYRIVIGTGDNYKQVFTEMCKEAGVKTIRELDALLNYGLSCQTKVSSKEEFELYCNTTIPDKNEILY